jgi:hypothetical protein
LCQILPPPKRKSPTRKQAPRAKHPDCILTTPDSLKFIREKDGDFQCRKLKAPKTSTEHVKAAVNSQPQPFFEGFEGCMCSLCFSEFGATDALECEKFWVKCPNCKAQFHHGCIKTCGDCTCGQKIRLKRKPKDA